GRCSRCGTGPRWSRARCARGTRGPRRACGGCCSTSSSTSPIPASTASRGHRRPTTTWWRCAAPRSSTSESWWDTATTRWPSSPAGTSPSGGHTYWPPTRRTRPGGTLTNLGLFGNGRAFEYLITKMAGHELPECRQLANDLHRELSLVIPSFVRRALDDRYGRPAAERMAAVRVATARRARRGQPSSTRPTVRLLEFDPDAERKVAAAALFPHSNLPLDEQDGDPKAVLDALFAGRSNRRLRAPRALEHAQYVFEITANFAAYRDLHRHRMLTQDRQLLGTSLGYDVPAGLVELGLGDDFSRAVEEAAAVHLALERALGSAIAQYIVPIAFHVRWYFRANLREVFHLCELRTTPQGHPDYRWVAQQMFLRVREVHPRLAGYASFVDLGEGDELERRASERRIDQKLSALQRAKSEFPS